MRFGERAAQSRRRLSGPGNDNALAMRGASTGTKARKRDGLMIGFLVGTLCLLGLLRVLRRERGERGGNCGNKRCGSRKRRHDHWRAQPWRTIDDDARREERERDAWDEHPYRGRSSEGDEAVDGRAHARDREDDHEHGYGGGFRRKAMMWEAFRRLDTTPGQEKALRAIIEGLRDRRREIRDDLSKARIDVARALRGEQWDESALGEAVARVEAATTQIRTTMIDALAKTHEILDDKQRNKLADLIEKGRVPGFGRMHRERG
jgi:Spy/CpxP family protein refolding chaperone